MWRKQKPPEERETGKTVKARNHALKPIEINIVKRQERAKPSHQSIRGEFEWSEAERKC